MSTRNGTVERPATLFDPDFLPETAEAIEIVKNTLTAVKRERFAALMNLQMDLSDTERAQLDRKVRIWEGGIRKWKTVLAHLEERQAQEDAEKEQSDTKAELEAVGADE